MDAGYISAVAALSGSVIGGLTSLAASWLSQNAQAHAQQSIRNREQRQALYKAFIEEASRLYAHSLETDEADITDMVKLYAFTNEMRVVSAAAVAETAEGVVRLIIETYFGPNRTLGDLRKSLATDWLDPLQGFSQACRKDLDLR